MFCGTGGAIPTMNWLIHPIPNTIIAYVLYQTNTITSIPLLIFFISLSILIDIDHILFFLIKYRDKTKEQIIKIWKHHRKHNISEFYIFHSPELNIILLILSPFNIFALLAFTSNIIHIALDIIPHVQTHRNMKWIKEWSIIHQLTK